MHYEILQISIKGGPDNEYKVIMFDPVTNTYNDSLPTLNHKKSSSGCTVFNSKHHGGRPVVLAAGGRIHHAELYDYTVSNALWTQSKIKTGHNLDFLSPS